MSILSYYVTDINRLADNNDDLRENAMWYIYHFPHSAWTYKDIKAAGFSVLDCVEGTLADSCICEDSDGNVVIFAEKALNCWCSALVPIMKETAAETWRYWVENFAESEEDENY